MTWDVVADVVAAAGPLVLIPAGFVAGFLVRLERWWRLVGRVAEAIGDRIADGKAGGEGP